MESYNKPETPPTLAILLDEWLRSKYSNVQWGEDIRIFQPKMVDPAKEHGVLSYVVNGNHYCGVFMERGLPELSNPDFFPRLGCIIDGFLNRKRLEKIGTNV